MNGTSTLASALEDLAARAHAAQRCLLEYAGLSWELKAHSRLLAHVRNFLQTHMRLSETDALEPPLSARICVADERAGPALLEGLRAATPLRTAPTRAPYLASSGTSLELPGATWFFSEPSGCLIRVSRDAREILIVATDASERATPSYLGSPLEEELLRVVRAVVIFDVQRAGAAVCHAACVDRDGKGTAVLAERGGGKSTFISKLLGSRSSERCSRFVSADRLLVFSTSGLAHGWPSYSSIGLRTVVDVPALHALLTGRHAFALGRPLSDDECRIKIVTPPATYRDALSFEMSPTTTLHRLIFPTPVRTGLVAVRLTVDDARARLVRNIHELIESEECDWLGLQRDDAVTRAARIDQIALAVADCTSAYLLGTPDIAGASCDAIDDYLRHLEESDGS